MRTGLTFVSALLLACTAAPEAGDVARGTAPLEPATRDSAGVTIHEHPGDALKRAPLVTFTPDPIQIHVGTAGADSVDVSMIGAWQFLTNGDLVGFERGRRAIAVFAAGGGSRWDVGRAGSGPGEFRQVGSLTTIAPDTVLVFDSGNSRLMRVVPRASGMVATTLPGYMSTGFYRIVGTTRDGAILFSFWSLSAEGEEQSGPRQRPISVGSWREGDDSVDAILTVPGMLQMQKVDVSPNGLAISSRQVAFASTPLFLGWGDELLVTEARQWRFERWGLDGALRSVLKVDAAPRPIETADRERELEHRIALYRRMDPTYDVSGLAGEMEAEPQLESFPFFSRLVGSPDGRMVWAIDFRESADTTGWAATAFDQDGRILGRIEEAVGDPPVAIGNDRMAFRTEDDLGIATITVRRIVMP